MTSVLRGPIPDSVAAMYPHDYAVVDVETSGLSAAHNRVLQIAVFQVRADGALESSWTTLLDPGCDPGPVHIHGLTRERLHGAPMFADVAEHVATLLAGRVMVAHNARFDWDFVYAEASRANISLAVANRLCTIALTRRLDIPSQGLSLAAVAEYWGVSQSQAHDANDDTRVVTEILRHSLVLAQRLEAVLPLTPCGVSRQLLVPPAAPRVPCLWRYPGRWQIGTPLRQGMKIVVTGETKLPREALTQRASRAGLDVMNSVSSRTSLVVCNSSATSTRKAQFARQHQTPLVSESELFTLLAGIVAGDPKATAVAVSAAERGTSPDTHKPDIQAGPLTRHRVLILGGTHDEAAEVRRRIAAMGGQPSVNLTAAVTHVVALPGYENDSRWARVRKLNLTLLNSATLQAVDITSDVALVATEPASYVGRHWAQPEPITLPRGGVTDLPSDVAQWSLSISWPDHAGAVDVVAFVVDEDEQVNSDEDFCFYNNPEHPTGAVALDLDTPTEAVADLRPDALPGLTRRVVIAAAVAEGATFGQVGPIELALRDPNGVVTVRATLDAADQEQTLLLANVYQRGRAWRFRTIGQGYRRNLAALAVTYGVDIDEE